MTLVNTDELLSTVICGDCQTIIKTLDLPSNVVVITDPPYPDYYAEEYQYKEGILDFLKDLPYKQIIFWSCKAEFPLDYSAIHIWDKRVPTTPYERIFERNGKTHYKLYSHYLINSTVAANFTGDVFNEHPSQKPIKLMQQLIEDFSEPGDIILDPFAGSGTTLEAAKKLNRHYIGIEINPDYVKIANERLRQGVLL